MEIPARRKKKKPFLIAGSPALDHERSAKRPTANRFAVTGVTTIPLPARALVTIGVDAPIWRNPDWDSLRKPSRAMEGAIVRILPPAGITDEKLSQLEEWVKRSGAAKIRIGSRAQADVAPQEERFSLPQENRRELILGMAETSKRRDELKELLDIELKRVGM